MNTWFRWQLVLLHDWWQRVRHQGPYAPRGEYAECGDCKRYRVVVGDELRHTSEFCPIYCTAMELAYARDYPSWVGIHSAFIRAYGVAFPAACEPRQRWKQMVTDV